MPAENLGKQAVEQRKLDVCDGIGVPVTLQHLGSVLILLVLAKQYFVMCSFFDAFVLVWWGRKPLYCCACGH